MGLVQSTAFSKASLSPKDYIAKGGAPDHQLVWIWIQFCSWGTFSPCCVTSTAEIWRQHLYECHCVQMLQITKAEIWLLLQSISLEDQWNLQWINTSPPCRESCALWLDPKLNGLSVLPLSFFPLCALEETSPSCEAERCNTQQAKKCLA